VLTIKETARMKKQITNPLIHNNTNPLMLFF
jgi:hypothetical protein